MTPERKQVIVTAWGRCRRDAIPALRRGATAWHAVPQMPIPTAICEVQDMAPLDVLMFVIETAGTLDPMWRVVCEGMVVEGPYPVEWMR